MITLATKTKAAIENNILEDQGARYRLAFKQVMPHMTDAYRGADPDGGFRSHLGASIIGKECARAIWYGFRWARAANFSGRMIRLFHRGHSEEARFLAMLLAIGCQVYQQDANGKQFRISDVGGHFGGSGDGVVIGLPDVPPGAPCLAEFKTHGEKSFLKLVKEGVRVAKFEHFVQMQIYMRKMNILYAMYGAVNKNTDEIHLEMVTLDANLADQFLDRGRQIIMMRSVPEKMPNASPGFFACRFCDVKDICHSNASMDHNCRTCHHAVAREDGTWWCESKERQTAMLFDGDRKENDVVVGETYQLTKERQLTGCQSFYSPV